MSFEMRGLKMDIDIPTWAASVMVTCMRSVSSSCTEQSCARGWKLVIYENGHRRLEGWEVGHSGRYSRVLLYILDVERKELLFLANHT